MFLALPLIELPSIPTSFRLKFHTLFLIATLMPTVYKNLLSVQKNKKKTFSYSKMPLFISYLMINFNDAVHHFCCITLLNTVALSPFTMQKRKFDVKIHHYSL